MTPDDAKRLTGEVDALLKIQPNPLKVDKWRLQQKYSGPNPYAGPDPQGDAEVQTPNGLTSTPATRAVTRAKLAEAWEDGRRAFEAANPAA